METNFEIIKTRNLFLSVEQVSDEVILVDNTGNMHFTFRLTYANNGSTHINIIDEYHAQIIIETEPNAVTKLASPYQLGKYENNKDLFFNFVVQPRNADGTHSVTITFYTK